MCFARGRLVTWDGGGGERRAIARNAFYHWWEVQCMAVDGSVTGVPAADAQRQHWWQFTENYPSCFHSRIRAGE
jgi:hypothetical protein